MSTKIETKIIFLSDFCRHFCRASHDSAKPNNCLTMISSRIFSTRKDTGTNNCCALNTLTNLKQKSDKNIIFVEVKQQQP